MITALEVLLYIIIGWIVTTIAFKVFDLSFYGDDSALLFGGMMLMWWIVAAILIFFGLAKLGMKLSEYAIDKITEKYNSVTKKLYDELNKLIKEQQEGEKR